MGNSKITFRRHGYVLEMEHNSLTFDQAAEYVAKQAKALDHALLEEFGEDAWQQANGKPPLAIKDDDDRMILSWIASQQDPRAQNYIIKNGPLTERRARASLKRLLKLGELELRPAEYEDSRGVVREMQGVFFANVDPPPLLPQ